MAVIEFISVFADHVAQWTAYPSPMLDHKKFTFPSLFTVKPELIKYISGLGHDHTKDRALAHLQQWMHLLHWYRFFWRNSQLILRDDSSSAPSSQWLPVNSNEQGLCTIAPF